jgi:predicted solute-binding protein
MFLSKRKASDRIYNKHIYFYVNKKTISVFKVKISAMKKLLFNKNKKRSGSLVLDQEKEIKSDKQYKKFYDLVRKRVSSS